MAKLCCLSSLIRNKKKVKDNKPSQANEYKKDRRTLQITLEDPVKPFESDVLKSTSFSVLASFGIRNNSKCNVKVIGVENPVGREATERAYEGEDEHEENALIKRNVSDFDLQIHVANSGAEESNFKTSKVDYSDSFETELNEKLVNKAEKDVDPIHSGNFSDPGFGRAKFWASPRLKRSCSNLETREVLTKMASHLPLSKSQSFDELEKLSARMTVNFNAGSPASVMSHCSADRVMLKKHSSSQVLPSRSRRLWWKLFLWSHRNLHKPWTSKSRPLPIAALNHQGGYSSDTLETNQAMKLRKMESPGSFTAESLNKGSNHNYNDNQNSGGFHTGASSLWPQNQWVAFSAESSSFTRVDEWVKDLNTPNPPLAEDDNNSEEGIIFPSSPEAGRSLERNTACLTQNPDVNISEEILHANSVIQTLNSSSAVAHISSIGLKAIPTISRFSSLRSVNLSNNFIVHISPGSLPKGLHSLNLSRNKISTIEGLRELTRLRVLDLSYNRISRIGQGLSNCTLVKELYLDGNKISDAEGLHRLLKLAVLDLSFNKITTTKALAQIVANYNSLLAFNLLGNPIQSNISDDLLRKAVCGLLPKLVYLNRQPIKPQRVREVLTDSVAKAALGNSNSSSRRKTVRRGMQDGSVSSSGHRSSLSVKKKSRNRSKSQTHHHLAPKTLSSAHVSSSH